MGVTRPIVQDIGTQGYWLALLRKLPRGVLWLQQGVLTAATYVLDGLPIPLTWTGRVLLGLAGELSRVHGRINDLFAEARPQTTVELLDELEAAFGLPEFGYDPAGTADRQAALSGKYAALGGQSAAYFEALALSYGAVVDCYDGPWDHWWTAEGAGGSILRACCTSSCTAALVEFATAPAQRVAGAFTHYKPAHSIIFWTGDCAP